MISFRYNYSINGRQETITFHSLSAHNPFNVISRLPQAAAATCGANAIR